MKQVANPDAPIHERSLIKTKVTLKKDMKDNWGRFLDYHYDPNIHNRPFISTKHVPKDSYHFSTAGLSHKFLTTKVLQNYDVEEKKDRTKIKKRFKELTEMREGEIYVFIEHCSNSEQTQLSTSHNEK